MRDPIVVFELLLGILVGPCVLGWAHSVGVLDDAVAVRPGDAVLRRRLRDRVHRVPRPHRPAAIFGWLISLAAGVGARLDSSLRAKMAIIIGIALCSTALGTILPILRDAGELNTPFGQAISAVGAVGEFGPLIAISIFLGASNPGIEAIVLVLFARRRGARDLARVQACRAARCTAFVNATLHTSGQFAIRVVLLILAALVALSIVLDLDMLLGAFTAGIVWRLLMRDASTHADREVESKVEAVAFGFLVPLFFIYTGVTFDLAALLADPILLLAAAGRRSSCCSSCADCRRRSPHRSAPPGVRRSLSPSSARPGCRSSSRSPRSAWTRTPHVRARGRFVGAGMLSVLLFPLIAMTLRGERNVRAERAARGRSGVTVRALLDAAPAPRSPDAPREALGELIVPRQVLGIGRSPRIVRRGAAWHLGVLLVTDEAVLATGDIVRARQEARRGFAAESQRQRAELAAAARRGGFAEGESVHIGWTDARSRRGRARVRHPVPSPCATASRACDGAPRAGTCRWPHTSTSGSSCCGIHPPGRRRVQARPKAAGERPEQPGGLGDGCREHAARDRVVVVRRRSSRRRGTRPSAR